MAFSDRVDSTIPYELKIDDTYFLLIDDTYKLGIQGQSANWTNRAN